MKGGLGGGILQDKKWSFAVFFCKIKHLLYLCDVKKQQCF